MIPEIPDSCAIVVEGTADSMNSVFVQMIGHSAQLHGRRVTYVTSRSSAEVEAQMHRHLPGDAMFDIIEDFSPDSIGVGLQRRCVHIIDSFSYLMIDEDLNGFRKVLEAVKTFSRVNESIVLLTTESGMLERRCEITAEHLADGVIQFMSREVPEGVVRFVRVPKWVDGRSLDKNLYYTFDGAMIKVDQRSRVL